MAAGQRHRPSRYDHLREALPMLMVLLSITMAGQRVLATASDKQALQTFRNAEAVLQLAATAFTPWNAAFQFPP